MELTRSLLIVAFASQSSIVWSKLTVCSEGLRGMKLERQISSKCNESL